MLTRAYLHRWNCIVLMLWVGAAQPCLAQSGTRDATARPALVEPAMIHAQPSAGRDIGPNQHFTGQELEVEYYPEASRPGCDAGGNHCDDGLYSDELAMHWDEPLWRPFDLLRDLGFRHSSTHGRHVGRGVPLERSSWLNRPVHVDWFLGPLLSDDLVDGSVGQSNTTFGGVRLGWDFDYYWGIQGRLGTADPDIVTADTLASPNSGTYFVGDIDLVYYPWGDTKVRPYMVMGVGLARVGSVHEDGSGNEVTLLGLPVGGGVQFPQTPWLAWRLEVLDNLAFGADGVSTMHNISVTAGMELRLGARPRSYWPWRSSRNVW